MPAQTSIAELESPDKIAHQRREWLVERLGWGLIALVLAAGLLGALGPGLLGTREATSSDGSLRAKYSLVERYDAPNVLELWLVAKESSADRPLEISRSAADRITIEQIIPHPAASSSRADKLALHFRAPAGGGELKVICRYKHNEFGLLNYELGLAGHEPLQIRQLVLP
jgi:hypothetical protein